VYFEPDYRLVLDCRLRLSRHRLFVNYVGAKSGTCKTLPPES
jgi:hypothetical protein